MQREIIFSPKKSSKSNSPSYFLAFKMVLTTLKTCFILFWGILWHKATAKETDAYIKKFAADLLNDSHTTLEVVGQENFDHKQSYVFMSNHMSYLDVPVLMAGIPQSLRMIAKSELFAIPIFGTALEKAEFVRIDRKNRHKAIKQLETAKERLRRGISIWISPEGTRNKSNNLNNFKKGGFHIAIDLAVPIVPIWIDKSNQVMHPDSFMVYPNKQITLYFGKPVTTNNLTKFDLPKLMLEVRNEITALNPNQNGLLQKEQEF